MKGSWHPSRHYVRRAVEVTGKLPLIGIMPVPHDHRHINHERKAPGSVYGLISW
jgi:hypothetical protein